MTDTEILDWMDANRWYLAGLSGSRLRVKVEMHVGDKPCTHCGNGTESIYEQVLGTTFREVIAAAAAALEKSKRGEADEP